MKKVIFVVCFLLLAVAGIVGLRVMKDGWAGSIKIAPNLSPFAYSYPISNYDQRLRIRVFGQKVGVGDEKKYECGNQFIGYHTGDDLETTDEEKKKDVPIKSIAAGTVREVGWFKGYGGLVVVENVLEDQTVTSYYGHMSIGSVSLKPGEKVEAGSSIGKLGTGCTAETDFERKHLHFAIHKGGGVDIRGYVQNPAELADWLDPKMELKKIRARIPNF